MKSALKLLVFLGIGCLIGIVLVCAGIVSFTDMTWNELVQKLAKIEAVCWIILTLQCNDIIAIP